MIEGLVKQASLCYSKYIIKITNTHTTYFKCSIVYFLFPFHEVYERESQILAFRQKFKLDIPLLSNIQPEDIEDVSEKYRPYLGMEFESDTVKRIRLYDMEKKKEYEPLFIISLTEHKSAVDYNVAIQILKYMVCIWLEYGKEMEQKKQGITHRKSFRYPAIIPVVYYEGKEAWTAGRNLRDRVSGEKIFANWIPDFTYEVIRIHNFSDEELLERGNDNK